MKVYFASLNPCNTRKVNAKQYISFISSCGHELVTVPNDADIIFVWGCEFRNDWRIFTHCVLKELKETYVHAEVVYIGCTFSGSHADEMSKEFGVDVIPWKDSTEKIEKKLVEVEKKLKNESLSLVDDNYILDIEEYKRTHPTERVWFEDEYIKVNICEGCTGYCTYCSEKLMFPKFRSFSENDILQQCRNAINKTGMHKILFLADSSGEYGKDTSSSLPQLITRLINEVDSELKIGITQMNPEHFLKYNDEMLGFIKRGVIDYLNIPIQTTNNKTLKAMNRKYTSSDIKFLFDEFQACGFTNYSTHLLVGFPGEEELEVDDNIKFLSKYRMRHIIVSAFMNHPAIEASKFPKQLSLQEKRIRVQKYKNELGLVGIKVHSDLGGISNRLMESIKLALGITLNEYTDRYY